MRNRAKCKLCGDILESFHRHDWVTCKCGEISIDGGGDVFHCEAKSFDNFLRVDDMGNEIIPKVINKSSPVQESSENKEHSTHQPMSYKEKVDMLHSMIKNMEDLPTHVMSSPINHYDFYSYMLLVANILSSQK